MHVTDAPASASASTKGDIASGDTPGRTGVQPGPEVIGNSSARWYTGTGSGGSRFSPIVADGRVFITGDYGDGGPDRMFTKALDAATGDSLWDNKDSFNNSPRFQGGGLAYSQGILFVGGFDGALYAIDPASGAVKWTQSIFQTDEGPSFAPIAVNGVVYTNTGAVSAWDAKTGQKKWTQDASSDGQIAIADGRVIVTVPFSVVAFDANNGKEVWTENLHSPTSLVADEGMVFVCDSDKNDRFGLDGSTGKQLLTEQNANCDAPVLVGGQLYTNTSSGIAVLDAKSGNQLSMLIGTSDSTCGISLADLTIYECSAHAVQGFEARPGGGRVFEYDLRDDTTVRGDRHPLISGSAVFIEVTPKWHQDPAENQLYSLVASASTPATPTPTIAPTLPPLPAAAAHCLSSSQMKGLPVGSTYCMVGEIAPGSSGCYEGLGFVGARDRGTTGLFGDYFASYPWDQSPCFFDNQFLHLHEGQIIIVTGTIHGDGFNSSSLYVDDLCQIQLIRPGETTPVPLGTENFGCGGYKPFKSVGAAGD